MDPGRAAEEVATLTKELSETQLFGFDLGWWQRFEVVVRRSLGQDSQFLSSIQWLKSQAGSKTDGWYGRTLDTLNAVLFELTLLRDENTVAGESLPVPDPETVFVVHGRDTALRDSMFRFLRALSLSPIEWETAIGWTGSATPYVGQILDAAFSKAQAVVVLLTPDEVAYLRPELAKHPSEADTESAYQARPNVLFEAGLAMGRHPDRTILVTIGETRPFSDIGGRMMVNLSDDPGARNALANRLKGAGCLVDTTGSLWLNEGTFVPSFDPE